MSKALFDVQIVNRPGKRQVVFLRPRRKQRPLRVHTVEVKDGERFSEAVERGYAEIAARDSQE
jgi:KaiC/GvpD/RAD55 family RecA-like ATPase